MKVEKEKVNKRFAQRFAWDPVFERNGVWFFWGEDYKVSHGPFNTEIEADAAFTKYCREACAS